MDDWEDDLLALAEAPVVKKKKKDKKKRKRESSGSDMELGGSGSDMDIQQSDSDADDAAPADDADDDEVRPDMFPLEGVYKDAQDRASLMAMNEMDREMVLEERREKLQKYQDRQLLKQMVADQDGAGSSDGEARPSRRRAPATKRAKQLEELKQKRKSKNEREERRAKKRAEEGSDYDSEAENRAHRAPSVPTFTDSEEDGEYDSDHKTTAAKSKKKGKSKEPAELNDIISTCLSRKHLSIAWPCSYFSELVEGAFVRLGVGQDKGEAIYRLARVVKVSQSKTSRLYRLEKHHTDVKLTLAIGNDQRDTSMEMMSNSPPTEREWLRYLAELQKANLPVPTKQEAEAKIETIKKYKDYALTEADINVILAKKKERANGDLHERHTLRNERDIAIRAGDAAEVARLDGILARMDARSASTIPQALNGTANGSGASPQNKGPMTLEERRRNLAMSSVAVGTPKAIAGKTASPAVSLPGSGANTPQRQPPLASVSSSQEAKILPEGRKVANQEPVKQNKFQKMLASKVDIDLGDF